MATMDVATYIARKMGPAGFEEDGRTMISQWSNPEGYARMVRTFRRRHPALWRKLQQVPARQAAWAEKTRYWLRSPDPEIRNAAAGLPAFWDEIETYRWRLVLQLPRDDSYPRYAGPLRDVCHPLLYPMPYVHTEFDEYATQRARSLRYYAAKHNSAQWSQERLAKAVRRNGYFAHVSNMPPNYRPVGRPQDLLQEVGIKFADPAHLPPLHATVDAHNQWTIIRWGAFPGSAVPAMARWLQTQVAAYGADRNDLFLLHQVPDASYGAAGSAVRAFPGSRWLNEPPQFWDPQVAY